MTAPLHTDERVVINRRIVTIGTYIEIQKRGPGTTIETAKVVGWKLDDDGNIDYLNVYGGKNGYAKAFTARPEHIRSVPLPKRQAELARLREGQEFGPTPRRGAR